MIIEISNKKYIGQCNALSYIFYNSIFKTNIFEEIAKLRIYLIKINGDKENTERAEEFYNILMKVIYIFIYTKNQNISSFDKFIEENRNKVVSSETINEVLQVLIQSFIDNDIVEQLNKINNDNNEKKSKFPEHEFLLMCLKMDISIECLEKLTYVDVMKILICYLNKNSNEKEKKATQIDIDKLLR